MSKYSLLIVLSFLFYGSELFADTSTHTIFAVDVSLSASDKNTAFDVISEKINTSPETHAIGLTLFDDTVRGFVSPEQLDKQQIEALHQSMTDAPVSVRSTSNLAVGIERAIDAFEPLGGANLIVFSRGVIDTKSDDPRAQFSEWLEQVLLPQAAQSNIAVSLVIRQTQSGSESSIQEIKDLFAKSDNHSIISSASDVKVAPELLSLLNIPARNYGELTLSDGFVAESTISAVSPEATPEATPEQPNAADTHESSTFGSFPLIRLILLAVCLALLFGIVIWRFRARRVSSSVDHTSQSSSSYLPLTRKPSEAMEEYMEKETDLVIKPDSQDKQ